MDEGPQEKKTRTPPWRKKAPRGRRRKMTAAQIAMARERAAKAGRPYPNLIDNMWASTHGAGATKKKKRKKAAKKAAKKSVKTAKKKSKTKRRKTRA